MDKTNRFPEFTTMLLSQEKDILTATIYLKGACSHLLIYVHVYTLT